MALVALFPGCRSTPPSSRAQGLEERLEVQAEELRRQYDVPGVALAIVRKGKPVLSAGLGQADLESGRPVTDATLFQAASVSKSVTAWGVMRLVEEGIVDLDDPVRRFLPHWPLPPSRFDPRGVTVRRLLSHTAGLGLHGAPGFPPWVELPSLDEFLRGRTGGAGPIRLELAPGTALRYSGGGYGLLQMVLEEASGTPFATLMERHVLDPLRMGRSGFGEVDRSTLATPYSWNGEALPDYRFVDQAAAGLYTTASDLARFVAALTDRGMAELQTRDAALEMGSREELFTPQPATRGTYALGHVVEHLSDGTRLVSHRGSSRGWRSLFAVFPSLDEGIVVLTNSDRGVHLTSDLLCAWSMDLVGEELASCWVERKRRGTIFAIAAVLAFGLALNATGFLFGLGNGLRAPVWAIGGRGRWVALVQVALAASVAILWVLFWYTDQIIARREGVENFIPAASTPATFWWLTLAVLLWCGAGILRGLFPTTGRHRFR